jgi:hypothetical protein
MTATDRDGHPARDARVHYLNFDKLDALDAAAFRTAEPYPWSNPADLLTAEGYTRLLESLPDVEEFENRFGVQRAHGQQSHDRWALEYRDDLDVDHAWHDFVAELRGPEYRAFVSRMFPGAAFRLSFHWHYTPRGCSVSPHCDNRRKLGSHLFYLSDDKDWDPAWGGETLILDDADGLERRSAPGFDDFREIISAEALGNRSLLFHTGPGSWHGVRKITCPEGIMRKVFIVVINRYRPVDRVKSLFGRYQPGY